MVADFQKLYSVTLQCIVYYFVLF